jgi:hypothetical protein
VSAFATVMDDFPVPGDPQIKTGCLVETRARSAANIADAFIVKNTSDVGIRKQWWYKARTDELDKPRWRWNEGGLTRFGVRGPLGGRKLIGTFSALCSNVD